MDLLLTKIGLVSWLFKDVKAIQCIINKFFIDLSEKPYGA